MYSLREETQVAVLLCAHTVSDPVQPLSSSEYVRLVQWLQEKGFPLEALLSPDMHLLLLEAEGALGLSAERLEQLLGRGGQLALWLEGWSNAGMWLASWNDTKYPPCFAKS